MDMVIVKISDSPIDDKILWFDKQVSKENFLNIVKIINYLFSLVFQRTSRHLFLNLGQAESAAHECFIETQPSENKPRKMNQELHLAKVRWSDREFQTPGAPAPATYSTVNLKSNVLNYR